MQLLSILARVSAAASVTAETAEGNLILSDQSESDLADPSVLEYSVASLWSR